MTSNSFSHFLHGFLQILITGEEINRFLNLCRIGNIPIYQIECESNQCYSMHIRMRHFFLIKSYAKKTHTKVHILSKKGLPFLVMSISRRIPYVICIFLCLSFLAAQSNYLMHITIDGNESLSDEMLIDFLSEQSVLIGVKKDTLDIEAIEKKIRNQFPQVTWTSVRMNGNCMYVMIKENRLISHEPKTQMQECDLVSTHTGRIHSIVTRAGTPCVKRGDLIEQGSLLVSGRVPIMDDGKNVLYHRYVAADADIVMDYVETIHLETMLTYQKKFYTGRQIPGIGIQFSTYQKRFPLFPVSERKYTLFGQKQQWHLGENLYLPIYTEVFSISEYVINTYEYSDTEAKELLNQELSVFFESLEKKGVQIIENNVKIEKDMQKMYLTCDVLLRGECGMQQMIQKEENSENPGESENE